MPVKERRDGIRLLARRAAGAPHRQRLLALPERGDHPLRHGGERVEVAEELRDVDGERIEQAIVLRAVAVEHARIVVIRVHPPRAHADRDAAAKALLLVARTAEAALTRDLRRQCREPGVRQVVHGQSTCRTASRLVRTMAFVGSSSSACSQQRTASSRSCRLNRMLPSLRYTSSPNAGLSLIARW